MAALGLALFALGIWDVRRSAPPTKPYLKAVVQFMLTTILSFAVEEPLRPLVVLGGLALAGLWVLPHLFRKPHNVRVDGGSDRLLRSCALGIVASMFVSDAFAGAPSDRLLRYGLSAVFLAGLLTVSARASLSNSQIGTALAVALGAALAVGPFIAEDWLPCRPEKCGLAGGLYKGIFPSENTPALLAGLALAFSLSLPKSRSKQARVSLLLLIIIATGNRTALVALIAALIASWLAGYGLSRRVGRDHPELRLRRAALLLPGAIVGASLAMLYLADQDSLSNRGRVWMSARKLGAGNRLTGSGLHHWDTVRLAAAGPDHGAHSEVIHLLLGGGIVAALLYILLGGALLRRCTGPTKRALAFAGLPIIYVWFTGITEVIWNPGTVDGLALVMAAVLVASSTDLPGVPHHRHAPLGPVR